MSRIAVIGAGPAGLTAAYVLTKHGAAVDLYEASDSVGGLARSISLWGQTVDLGPHRFFSRDRRVNSLWLEVVGKDYVMVNRLTRILYKGSYFHYPLRAPEVLRKLGPVEAVRCLGSYVWAQVRRGRRTEGGWRTGMSALRRDGRTGVSGLRGEGSFEEWVCGRFGRRLFGIFFETYSEKLWGISCHELDADFAAQRIKRFSLGAAMRNALGVGGREHRTLADQFAYGSGGTGMVYERMARTVRERGGRIFLKTPVRRVVTEQGRVAGIEFGDRNFRPYERVISSMPLTALVARLPEAPEEVIACSRQLRFRNTILVYLEVQGNSICRDNWIYVHSPELQTGRITNFRNWSPQLYVDSPNSILALEYWCNEEDTLWTEPDERLIALATRELLMTGLAGNEGLIENGTVYRIPKCYPVYRRGYRELLEPVRSYLDGIGGLQVIGRYGAFKYNNQDHSILMGLLAAENVLHDKANDLWGVNADYESYQEGCRITETGLVKSE